LAFICIIGIHKSFVCDATPLDDYVNAPDTNVISNSLHRIKNDIY
jgi:hypothetical protein